MFVQRKKKIYIFVFHTTFPNKKNIYRPELIYDYRIR